MDFLALQSSRNRLKAAMREWFSHHQYLEIDTPLIVTTPGSEVYLNYFATEWQDYDQSKHRLFLRSSPELHMKQAIAKGAQRIFQIGACFRNGGELSDWHHPEFTMLEYYQTGIDFESFVTLTEDLVRHCFKAFNVENLLPKKIERLTVTDAFAQFAGINLIDGDPHLAAKAILQGVTSVRPEDSFEDAYFKTLIERIEPALANMKAVVLWDYPPSQAALAKVEQGFAKRFEIYIGRIELCNGFHELTDPSANQQVFIDIKSKRTNMGLETPPNDPDFEAALNTGIPPCCGNAVGFDRLLALLNDSKSLADAVPFRNAAPWRKRLTP